MNIAILCYHRIGGSGIVAYEVGRAMAETKGHQVHFMGLEPPFRLREGHSEAMKFHKVYVQEYPVFDFQPYSLALASQLSTLIRRDNIDVIHSHYAIPHAVSALLARDIANRDVRCVTTLHGTDITIVGAHPTMMDITRYAIEKSDEVSAVSNHLRLASEEKLGITPGKIKTVYNFVNPDFFNPSLKSVDDCRKTDKITVIHLSNLRPVKRPLDVIRIFHAICRAFDRPIELKVVGQGPLESEMVALAENLGIADKVKFLGIRSDINCVIASAHLVLLPSQEESFGLAALEGMACKVPVVASRVGGLPELIDDGKTGILFTLGNIEEAAEKAVHLLKDPELYRSIQEAAFHDARVKFSMAKIVDQYEALYRGNTKN